MPAARRSIVIKRDPADVFAFLSDGTTATRWRSGVVDIAHVRGLGVGAVYKQGVSGPGGRRVDADYEVTASEPGQRLAFRAIAGPVRPAGEYVLEAAADGTRLTFSLGVELGRIQGVLMGGMVQKTMDAEMAALDRLKAVLEA
jgi:uncharacterized protein YndB with AHSA1/START domain